MFKSIFLLSFIGGISTIVDTQTSDGVRSMGVNILYGDDHMTVINQVVKEGQYGLEKLKPDLDLNSALPPLPSNDVKCLMSVDRYCSKDMLKMKNILVQALKEDCAKCTVDEKEEAGKVVASMLAHDPVAWKMFLTRYDSLDRIQRILG